MAKDHHANNFAGVAWAVATVFMVISKSSAAILQISYKMIIKNKPAQKQK